MKNVLALIYNNINPRLEGEFLESLRKRGVREGEEELILAILEDAIACFQKYVLARDARGKTLFRDAEEWILEEGSDWIFAFENICEVLGLDPKYLRQGLMRWKERMLSSRPMAKVYHLSSRGGKKYAATGPESIKDMRKAQAS